MKTQKNIQKILKMHNKLMYLLEEDKDVLLGKKYAETPIPLQYASNCHVTK